MRSIIDRTQLKLRLANYHNAIKQAKQDYYCHHGLSSLGNPRALWKTVHSTLYRHKSSPLPTPSLHAVSLHTTIANYFTDKIARLRLNNSASLTASRTPHLPEPPS